MPKTPSRNLKKPLTPAGFRRLIAKEMALVKRRPTTAAEAQDQLGAYYRISQIVNRLQSDRATYGDRQFTEFAAAVGYLGVWLYEVRFFAQRYSVEELEELRAYDRPLCWGHVRLLFPVHDKRRRRKLQRLATEEGWSTERLRQEIRARLGPGRHRGRAPRGLDSPDECLRKLNQLTKKWTRVAQAAVEHVGSTLTAGDVQSSAELRALVERTSEVVEQVRSTSGKLRRRLEQLKARKSR